MGALAINSIPLWGQNPLEVTQAINDVVIDVAQLDSSIFNVADSLEELLVEFLLILHNWSSVAQSNQRLDELLKRYIIAVVAVRCIEIEKLDHALELNVALPKLPTDGIGELVSFVDDIRDFYSCVNEPTSAIPTVESFTLDLKRS